MYGSEITGFENFQKLEKTHLDFLKSILKMKQSTPHIIVYEFGRFPLEIQAKTRMIKYWSKLLAGSHSKISSTLYSLLLYLQRNSIYSCRWILSIENILQSVGLNYIWLNNNVNNINWLCNEVKKRLQFQFIQKYNADIQESPKYINYRIFKKDFFIEKYMLELQPKFYIPLAKFRTTNNRLPIEKGRWEGIERSQRYCTLCNCHIIGDEFHYIFECECFTQIRTRYLPRFYLKHYSTLKFQKLMTTTNVKLLKRLCMFIIEVLKKF